MVGERVRMEREFENLALPLVSQFETAAGLLIPQYEAEAAAGDLRSRIVAVAEREWERWDRGRLKETDPKALRILTEYYATAVAPRKGDKLGDAAFHAKKAWSAVFVSYVMKTAGADKMFQYSRGHRYYVAAAKKARERNSDAFWACRITEVAPEPGDIVCNARSGSGLTFDNVDDLTVTRYAHGDIVTEVRPGRLVVIGGNTGQSFPERGLKGHTVGKKTIKIDERGLVVQRSHDPFFAIVKVQSAGAAVGATPPRSLPEAVNATVQQLLQRGLWAAAISMAILTGQRDVNHLTNLIFFFRHPELKGRRIRPDEKELAREWLDIRDRLVVPTVNRLDRASASI